MFYMNFFKKCFLYLGLITLVSNVNSINDEQILRNHIFKDYDKNIRPVEYYNNTIPIEIGIAIQNLESFNQIQENIDINLWLRKSWNDNNLKWNSSISNISFLSVDLDEVWVPDIELLNAASKPEIYTLKGGLNLYNSGLIMWSNPAIYSYSCSLELHFFPFDEQTCTMKFSSWIYDNSQLYLKPYDQIEKQIDVINSFSHSEWEIDKVILEHFNTTRNCCDNIVFSEIDYSITLRRFPHYYKLSMGMTISLVIVSFIIMLIKPDNVSRTGTAVFIPLTILALQLTIADKIPVVGYYTLMDFFFLTCFISSMIVSIESGLVYSLITSKDLFLYNMFKNIINIEKVYIKQQMEKERSKKKIHKHHNDITMIKDKQIDIDNYNEEFNIVMQTLNETSTDNLNVNENETRTDNLNENDNLNVNENDNLNINKTENETDNLNINKTENEIVKTINYDDPILNLTEKQILIFNRISEIVIFIDNIFRILLPLIFIIIISVIMSYEKK